MRLSRSSILFISCLTCLGFAPSSAGAALSNQNSENLHLTYASVTETTQTLRPGDTGRQVEVLQKTLKQLGYYSDVIDGLYGNSTNLAVSKFQKAKGLIVDGVFGTTTKEKLEAVTKETPPLSSASSQILNNSVNSQEKQQDLVWWTLVAIGMLGVVGALMYLVKRYEIIPKGANPENSDSETSRQSKTKPVSPASQELDTQTEKLQSNNIAFISPPELTTSLPSKLLASATTTRLTKVNIVDELIKDLHSSDPAQRRKAIWDLGQQGDSRAIQPLVELMMNVDSQQRSLILAALSEIGSRTVKPMSHALAMSLQDESPQVRQNAIRDLTRIYDSMAQFSQILSHAVQDPDAEVQATARYALSQINRIRTLPTQTAEEHQETRGDGEQD
jgi:peptidoglycan hydrolase-like protein with peptidoglycan-binding domain